MTLVSPSSLREVHGITATETARIRDFLQGAVYCWCKNRKGDWFAMRDLMGGDNFDWAGTPLQALYDKQVANGVTGQAAIDQAGKESGWLLKRVVSEDVRAFETKEEDMTRKYRWVQRAT